MRLTHDAQLLAADRQGWDVDSQNLKCVKLPKVTYYLMEHGWTCSQCSARVTIGQFTYHARRHHR